MLPEREAQAYIAATAELNKQVTAVQEQIRILEQPYRDQLKLERIEQNFPADVLAAVLTPEDERDARPKTIGRPGAVNWCSPQSVK